MMRPPTLYTQEERRPRYCVGGNGSMNNWSSPPPRSLSLHDPATQFIFNGDGGNVTEITDNNSRLPLPTHKLRESFIDRLKKRFTFRTTSSRETTPTTPSPQQSQPPLTFPVSNCYPHQQQQYVHQIQHSHGVVMRTRQETAPSPLPFPINMDDPTIAATFADTYLRPRKFSQCDLQHINHVTSTTPATMLQSGVLVDPWLLSSMVQPLSRHSSLMSTSAMSSSAIDSAASGWRLPLVACTSDSTRSSVSGGCGFSPSGSTTAAVNTSLTYCLRPPPPRYWLLAGFGWYWGPLTHSESTRLLLNRPLGAFLVRDSEQIAGRLTLTYRALSGQVLHHRIAYREGCYFFVAGEEFSSLPDLINHAIECSRHRGVYCLARDSSCNGVSTTTAIANAGNHQQFHGNAVCLLEAVDRRKQYSVKYKEEKAHDDSVWSCAWGKNEKDNTDYIVTGSLDDKVKVWKWNVDRLEHLHTLEGHHLGVISVDINKSGNMAASSSLDSQVRIWDLESGKQYRYIDGGPVDAWTVAFSPDSRFLASGSHTGNVNLFGVESAKKDHVIKLSGKFTLSIAYSPDGGHLAAGAIDGIISICDIQSEAVLPLDGHAMPVRALSFSPDGKYLVSASDDKQIKLYNVQTGTPECTLTGHSGLVVSADFNSDNKNLVTCSSDKTVRVWDLRNKSLAHTYYEHDDQVWCVRFNPAGSKLISVGDDRQLIVYDCPQ